jgi:hypothetical protein
VKIIIVKVYSLMIKKFKTFLLRTKLKHYNPIFKPASIEKITYVAGKKFLKKLLFKSPQRFLKEERKETNN